MNYLKKDHYYIDLYDLQTIKDCLSKINYWQNAYNEKKHEKGIDIKDLFKAGSMTLNYDLYMTQAERYCNKKETIDNWIDRDKKLQEKYDKTDPPRDIYCSSCDNVMVSTFKQLEDYINEPVRVLFFFECPSCKKRKGIYENGEERISKPQLCTKCSESVKVTYTKKKKAVTRISTCSSCGFVEKEEDDFAQWEKERNKEERENVALLTKYRAEFCLSEEEGKKYIEGLENLKRLSDLVDKWKKEQEDPSYQKAMQLKKLTVAELEKLLAESLKKEKFIELHFDKPDLNRNVIVPFTVQEADISRAEYDSKNSLKKLIKTALEGTNWRLMSEGITFRLGYLMGRLRGVETKEDLADIVRNTNKEDYIY